MKHYGKLLPSSLEWQTHFDSLSSYWDLFKALHGRKFVALSITFSSKEKIRLVGQSPLPVFPLRVEQTSFVLEVLVMEDEEHITVRGGNYTDTALGLTRGFLYGCWADFSLCTAGQIVLIQVAPFNPTVLADGHTFGLLGDTCPKYRIVAANRNKDYPFDVVSKHQRVLERLFIADGPGFWTEKIELSFSLVE